MSRPEMKNPETGEKASGTVKAGGEDKPAPNTYVKWDAEGVEHEQEGEKETKYKIAQQFNRLQMMNFNEHHHCYRGTHPKTQGCVIGKFIVHPDLSPELAQGMFKQPGIYDVIMRYSSLTPKLVADNESAPRGIGMKIFGVEGPKIWGEDKKTQDWTFNNYPILELRDAKTTHEIADSFERNFNDLSKFGEEQMKRVDADVATRGGQLPRQHMVAMPQYSQSAYRHGDYIAKYGVFPLSEAQKAIEKDYIKESDPINVISQHVRNFHMSHKVTYSFCAQLCQDLKEQPVEDIGIEWDEKKYPFQQIATLEFDPQDSWLPEFRAWWDDRITCNSWHGLVEHKPLGGTNRVRQIVYAESRKLRLRVNGFRDYIEPAGLDEVPAPMPAPQLNLAYMNTVQSTEIST